MRTDTKSISEVSVWKSTPGGPRGLLRLYVLHRLSKKPGSGYDLMSELSSLTGGSWNPGSGSIYPIFKDLERDKMIKIVSRGNRSKQLFALTRKGEETLYLQREMLNRFATKWVKIRMMITDFIAPKNLPTLLSEALRTDMASWEKVIESKDLPNDEKIFKLREHKLLMENQLAWIDGAIKKLNAK